MTSRIKHLSELPEWFDLKKYDNAKHLEATDWYEQFSLRSSFFSFFYYKINEENMQERLKKTLSDGLQALWKSPIFDINGTNKGEISELFYFLSPERLYEEFDATPAVHAMTLEEFQQIRKKLDSKRLDYTTKWEEQTNEYYLENLSNPLPCQPWIKQPLHHSAIEKPNLAQAFAFDGIDPVTIDLNFPDKVIIKQFKKYLELRRQESETAHLSKSSHPQNFSDWIRYGALPYLDLHLWEHEALQKIPLRVMADAIYPPGEGGEETVRKTTIPLAFSLLGGRHFHSLVAQIIEDLAKSKQLHQ